MNANGIQIYAARSWRRNYGMKFMEFRNFDEANGCAASKLIYFHEVHGMKMNWWSEWVICMQSFHPHALHVFFNYSCAAAFHCMINGMNAAGWQALRNLFMNAGKQFRNEINKWWQRSQRGNGTNGLSGVKAKKKQMGYKVVAAFTLTQSIYIFIYLPLLIF